MNLLVNAVRRHFMTPDAVDLNSIEYLRSSWKPDDVYLYEL